MDEVDIFLGTLKTATGSKKKLYTYSLKAWKEYCAEHMLTHVANEKDVDGFILWGQSEKHWAIGAIRDYLTPLAAFFKKHNQELRSYIHQRQKDLKNQMEAEKSELGQPLVFDIALKLLEAAEELRDRLCLWLVSVEGMSNLCLQEIQVRHIDFRQMTYSVDFGSRRPERGRMRPSTVRLIELCKNKYHLKPEDRLLNVSQRTMQNLPKKHARKIRLPQWNKVTLSKLRRLGNNNDLRELLVRAYEEKTLLPSS
jgi:hypothetical protein